MKKSTLICVFGAIAVLGNGALLVHNVATHQPNALCALNGIAVACGCVCLFCAGYLRGHQA